MKRLTNHESYCDLNRCDPRECLRSRSGGCKGKQLWDRLRAYEDTGLTPEQIHALKAGSCLPDRDVSGLLED